MKMKKTRSNRRRVNSNSALCATRAPTFFARARIAAAAFRRVRRRLSSSSTTTTGKKDDLLLLRQRRLPSSSLLFCASRDGANNTFTDAA